MRVFFHLMYINFIFTRNVLHLGSAYTCTYSLFYFENGDFDHLSDLAYRPHVSGENAAFQKCSPEWKTPATHSFSSGKKRRFYNTMSYIIYILALRLLRKEYCRIFVVLASSCGRAETIGIRYVWKKTEEKNLPFSIISGCVRKGP